MVDITKADIDYINLQNRIADSDSIPNTGFAHLYIKNDSVFIRLDDDTLIDIGSGGGATDLDGLTDVDTATTPPATGTILVFDGTNFVSLPVGADTEILSANSVTPTGLEWVAAGTGNVVSDEVVALILALS